jgi:RND family efflux transporter MFP subunit
MTEQAPKDQKHPAHGWLLIFGIAVMILFLFLWGWIPRMMNTKRIEAIAAENSLPKVTIMKIHPNTKPIELILPSSAQAWHMTPIWARVNGYLTRYLVDIGDVVKKGDLLAEIDTPETDEQVKQAQADLKNANIERDIAKITSDRWQRLWEKNPEAVSKQEVDQYNANYKSTEALIIASEKNLSRTTYQQKFKYIYAPFDGVITQRNIDIGSLIYGTVNGMSQELFQISQTHVIRFFVEVPQNYFRQIKEGVEAEITVQEFPGKLFKGIVTRYAKALDPTARTLLTEVDVENKEGILYAGLYGRVKFLIWPENINFIIPTTAIIIRSGFPQVAVVDDHHIVHLKQVQIGRDYGKEMEITFGLEENDRIVTIPSDRIREKTQVSILSD